MVKIAEINRSSAILWLIPRTIFIGSAETDLVQFKWVLKRDFCKTNVPFLRWFFSYEALYLRGESCLQNTHAYKQRGPCFKPPLNWTGSAFPLLILGSEIAILQASYRAQEPQNPEKKCENDAPKKAKIQNLPTPNWPPKLWKNTEIKKKRPQISPILQLFGLFSCFRRPELSPQKSQSQRNRCVVKSQSAKLQVLPQKIAEKSQKRSQKNRSDIWGAEKNRSISTFSKSQRFRDAKLCRRPARFGGVSCFCSS